MAHIHGICWNTCNLKKIDSLGSKLKLYWFPNAAAAKTGFKVLCKTWKMGVISLGAYAFFPHGSRRSRIGKRLSRLPTADQGLRILMTLQIGVPAIGRPKWAHFIGQPAPAASISFSHFPLLNEYLYMQKKASHFRKKQQQLRVGFKTRIRL